MPTGFEALVSADQQAVLDVTVVREDRICAVESECGEHPGKKKQQQGAAKRGFGGKGKGESLPTKAASSSVPENISTDRNGECITHRTGKSPECTTADVVRSCSEAGGVAKEENLAAVIEPADVTAPIVVGRCSSNHDFYDNLPSDIEQALVNLSSRNGRTATKAQGKALNQGTRL